MKATEEKCDFCSQRPAPWVYVASYGTNWGACRSCYELITAGDRAGLVERGVKYAPMPEFASLPRSLRQGMEEILREEIQKLHDEIFWRYCTTPPVYESIAYDGETQRSKP